MHQRDSDRTAVYQAEDLYQRMCARAHPPAGPVLTDLAGSQVVLPAERKFGDLDSVQRYVDTVLPPAAVLWPADLPPVRVRRRKGATKAHWEPPGTIALADDRAWLREFIVLHELAHHIDHHTRTQPAAAHGAAFRSALCRLHTVATGPVGGWALGIVFDLELGGGPAASP
jgi:putative metallohydrolase (TIGR04338 family)